MNEDKIARQQLIKLLKGGQTHIKMEDTLKDIPFDRLGTVHDSLPYSLWQLIEHIRFSQHDIVDFSRNPDYEEAKWPDDYWPASLAPKDEKEWKNSLKQIIADRDRMIELLQDTTNPLFAPIPHGKGQNLMREAMVLAEHNAHHIGQVIVIRRLLGIWKEKK